MVKVVEAEDNQFNDWVRRFLPQLFEDDFELEPGQVSGCWMMINRTIHTMISHRLLTALTENWFTGACSGELLFIKLQYNTLYFQLQLEVNKKSISIRNMFIFFLLSR